MADNTHISWTDATWNFLAGCTKCAPLCDNCYAIRDAHRMKSNPNIHLQTKYEGTTTEDGSDWTGLVKFHQPALYQPLRWSRGRKIFVNSMSDWAHKDVQTEWQDKAFAVMTLAEQHIYQLLSKRPKNVLRYLSDKDAPFRVANAIRNFAKDTDCPLSNKMRSSAKNVPYSVTFPMPHVWIGFSIGDQRTANNWCETIKEIAALGWLVWVSYEPAIAPVDWSGYEFIKWMVMGGESARPRIEARPSHPDWFRSTRDWAITHNIALHFKQWGEYEPVTPLYEGRDDEAENGRGDLISMDATGYIWHEFQPNDERTWLFELVGKKKAGRLLDGCEWNEFPNIYEEQRKQWAAK